MGLFDDLSNLVGSGLNAVDKKTQSTMINSSISKIENQKNAIYSEIGKTAFEQMKDNPQFSALFASHIKQLNDFNAEQDNLRARLTTLQNQVYVPPTPAYQPPAAGGLSCPACHGPIDLKDSFCMGCGKPISEIKASLLQCPGCGQVYSESVVFCEQCGSKVQPYVDPSSESAASAVDGASAVSVGVSAPTEELSPVAVGVSATDESSLAAEASSAVAAPGEAQFTIGEAAAENPIDADSDPIEAADENVASAEPFEAVADSIEPASAEPIEADVFSAEPGTDASYVAGQDGAGVQASEQPVCEETLPSSAPAVCSNCGEPLIEGAFFCGSCGARIS